MSPDYYSLLEQGRQANVSDEVLDALGRALRLNEVEQAHLRDLANPRRRPSRGAALPPQKPDPGLLRVATSLDHLPVLLLGRAGDVLARNNLLSALLGHPMQPGTSFVRYLILDDSARGRIVNWSVFASAMVASLRREQGRRPHDAQLRRLIDELRQDASFGAWWEDHGVRDYASVRKRIAHPVVGELEFDIEILQAPLEPDQHLVVYTCEPDSQTRRLLPLLASWASSSPSDLTDAVAEQN